MLNTKDIQEISKVFGITADAFKTAVTSESEVALSLPDNYTVVKDNQRKAGIEIGIKQLYKSLDVEYAEGDKTIDLASAKIKTHFSTKLTKAETDLTELKAKVAKGEGTAAELLTAKESYRTLKETHDKDTKAAATEIAALKNTAFTEKRDGMILGALPDNLSMEKGDLLILLNSKLDIRQNEAGNLQVMKADGTPETDTLGNALPAEKFIESYSKEHYLVKGKVKTGDNKHQEGGTYEEVYNNLKEEGVDPMSTDGQTRLAAAL